MVVCLALATAAVVWTGLLLPPPLWLVEYGSRPGCRPTGRTWTVEGVEFVEIGAGIFRMGSTETADPGSAPGRLARPIGVPAGRAPVPSDEMPVHWCRLPHGFAIATTEVTRAQFVRAYAAMGHEVDPAAAASARPIPVPFELARKYCEWLGRASELPVRLPTEAEWECACRAGTGGRFFCGNDAAELRKYARFDERPPPASFGSDRDWLPPAGSRLPNPFGIHDLAGSLLEWCEDPWHPDYRGAPTDGGVFRDGKEDSRYVVARGGAIIDTATFCRSASRTRLYRLGGPVGIRPVFTPPDR